MNEEEKAAWIVELKWRRVRDSKLAATDPEIYKSMEESRKKEIEIFGYEKVLEQERKAWLKKYRKDKKIKEQKRKARQLFEMTKWEKGLGLSNKKSIGIYRNFSDGSRKVYLIGQEPVVDYYGEFIDTYFSSEIKLNQNIKCEFNELKQIANRYYNTLDSKNKLNYSNILKRTKNYCVEEEIVLLEEKDFIPQTGKTDCYRKAVLMAKKTSAGFRPVGTFPYKQGIQVAKEVKSSNTHFVIPTEDLNLGINYIKKLIRHGIAAVVGVDHTYGKNRNDKTTDHYVTIIGMRKNYKTGETSFRYFDPGTIRGYESKFTFFENNQGIYEGPGFRNHIYKLSHVVLTN